MKLIKRKILITSRQVCLCLHLFCTSDNCLVDMLKDNWDEYHGCEYFISWKKQCDSVSWFEYFSGPGGFKLQGINGSARLIQVTNPPGDPRYCTAWWSKVRDARPTPPRGKTGCPALWNGGLAPPRKIDKIRGAQRGRFHWYPFLLFPRLMMP